MGGQESKNSDYNGTVVPDYYFKIITINKSLYYWIILTICTIAGVGNVLAIISVIYRKYKYLQKTCIISLAISDIFTIILFSMNNLDLLSKPLMTWPYGTFLCAFIPAGQILGNLASSLALLVIALDRYHNVIHALSKKWDPSLLKCILGAGCLWIICAGMSFPITLFYINIPFIVNDEKVYLCTGTPSTKPEIMCYYITMNVLFFFPIISMFFWFYYKIALLIWRHRKPLSAHSDQEITDNMSSSKLSPVVRIKAVVVKKRNVQMERKMRTFKIVLVLIFAFIGCRMPHWLYMVYSLVNSNAKGDVIWNLKFSFISLNLLNCALNPLLYTYLNQTIYVCRKINNFMCTICCCCFSNTEFEDYENGKPISEGVMGYGNRTKKPNVRQPIPSKDINARYDASRARIGDNQVLSKYIQKERY